MPEEPPKRATALRYTEGSEAPEVVASGRGEIARKILETAEEAGVPVRRDPALVEALADATGLPATVRVVGRTPRPRVNLYA